MKKRKAAKRKAAKVCKPKKKKAPARRRRPGSVTLVGDLGPGGFDVITVPNPDRLTPAKLSAGLFPPLDLKKAASKIPDNIKAPNFGEVRGDSWVKPGRYIMRNGSIAVVVEPVTLKFGEQMRQTWQGWKGHLEHHPHGEGLVWGLDGKRSDATPAHEHDLQRRHKQQARAA